VQHERGVLPPVLADILRSEALGQDRVELDGAELPQPAERIGDLKSSLGP
jgi:hypothetical protein